MKDIENSQIEEEIVLYDYSLKDKLITLWGLFTVYFLYALI